jgi:hypothetical protein
MHPAMPEITKRFNMGILLRMIIESGVIGGGSEAEHRIV